MKRRQYSKPEIRLHAISPILMQFTSGETDTVGVGHGKVGTGSALSRGYCFDDEEE